MSDSEDKVLTAENIGSLLNMKQKLFAEYYVCQEFFGHGFDSYCAAYGLEPKTKKEIAAACSAASRLLRNVNISKYINLLLEHSGLNDEFVDKELLFLITQKVDFKAKISAIKEYNAIKSRITKNIKHSGDSKNPINVQGMSTTTLSEIAKAIYESDKKSKK